MKTQPVRRLPLARMALVILSAGACNPQVTTPPETPPHETGTTTQTTTTTTSTETTVPLVELDVEVLPSLSCDNPQARDTIAFEQVTEGDWAAQPTPSPGTRFTISSGLAVADLDNDGFNDVVLPVDNRMALFLGDGQRGLVRVADRLPADLTGDFSAAVAVDVEGDGDLDLYVSGYNRRDALLLNDGTGHFVDVTQASGLGAGTRGIGSSWADLDGDGDLDLLAMQHGGQRNNGSDPSFIYRNLGNGTFEDITPQQLPGDLAYGHTLAGALLDLDLDRAPEAYLVNDFGVIIPNRLFWNRSGTLSPDNNASGVDLILNGMGLAETDLNNDGIPDLFVTGWGIHALMISTPGQFWVESCLALGILPEITPDRVVGWGADFGDIDNDGDDDLWVGYGFLTSPTENPMAQRDALWRQDSTGSFSETSEELGLDESGATRGGMLVDLDGDGWLDALKRNWGGPAVWHRANCGEEAWLSIQLRDFGANPFAVGAAVRVIDADGSKIRTMRAGGRSMASGGPLELHFGLGNHEAVTVEVTWPDGQMDTIQDISTRQRVRLSRQPD